MPRVPACATKLAGLSGSLMVRMPELEMAAAALVSVRLRTSVERTAGSSTALMTISVRCAAEL